MHPDFGRLVRPLVLTSAGFIGLIGIAAASATTALGIGGASVSTAIHNASHAVVTSVPAGTTVHDSVSVVGPLGTPTGTVTVSFFSNGTCGGTALGAWSASLASGGLDTAAVDVTASAMTPGAPGSVSYRATYNGNATYAKATGACEPLTVTRALPKLTSSMQLSTGKIVTGATVVIGTQVFMHVTVSGSFGTPTGTVQVEQYTGSTCTTTATVQFLTLSGGAVVTPAFSPPAGTFAFRAVYQGNATYASISGPCMTVTWVKATPSVAINVFGTNAVDLQPLIGGAAHGIATVTGALGVPTGTVTFGAYSSTDCSGGTRPWQLSLVDGRADTASANDVEIESVPTIRSWIVSYSGDAVYAARNSPCVVVHWKANPTGFGVTFEDGVGNPISRLDWSQRFSLGVTVQVGFDAPVGTVLASIWTKPNCTLTAGAANLFLVNGHIDDATPSVQLEPGTYAYSLQYEPGADSEYFGLQSGCRTFTVLKDGVFGEISDVDSNGNPAGSVGQTFHPRVVLHDDTAAPPVDGVVTIQQWFDQITCDGVPVATDVEPLVNGVADATALSTTPTHTGQVMYQVTYAGDAHFLPFSTCTGFAIQGVRGTPGPSLAPGVTPSPIPGFTGQPGESTAPGTSGSPQSSPAPGETVLPGTTVQSTAALASLVPGQTSDAVATDTAGNPIPSTAGLPSGTGVGDAGGLPTGLLIAIAAIVVIVGVGGWFGTRRRRRGASSG